MTRLHRLVAALVLMLAASACLELPETQSDEEPADLDTVDPDELRALISTTNLGVCTEGGWSGTVVNEAASAVDVTVTVTFLGLGSDELGIGTQPRTVPAGGEIDFEVLPAVAIDDIVLTCQIALIDVAAS